MRNNNKKNCTIIKKKCQEVEVKNGKTLIRARMKQVLNHSEQQ